MVSHTNSYNSGSHALALRLAAQPGRSAGQEGVVSRLHVGLILRVRYS